MMNSALASPDVMNSVDLTVLGRQEARLKWQRLQDLSNHFPGALTDPARGNSWQLLFQGFLGTESGFGHAARAEPGLENGWPDLGQSVELRPAMAPVGFGDGSGFPVNYAVPADFAAVAEMGSPERICATLGTSDSFKKRKLDKVASSEDGQKDKKIKGCEGERERRVVETRAGSGGNIPSSKNSNRKKDNNDSSDTSKDNSKVTEVPKADYIHVRARRGQATDSHSLAERVRREKISERMKYLQDLVPGCNKITGKAGMLDEIINYVQSLQRQVEFLSMKLAAVSPRLDFNIEHLFAKEAFPALAPNFQSVGLSPSGTVSPSYIQFNPMQQVASCSRAERVINPSPDMSLEGTTDVPASNPETILDPLCLPGVQAPSPWDVDLQGFYSNVAFDPRQLIAAHFQSQPFTDPIISPSNLKMEMLE